jgi:ribonuclease D
VSDELRVADVVGLDVETALDFGTLCLLQIAAPNRTFLIDPLAVGDLKPIIDVLSGSVPVKVIHNARFERRILATMGVALDGVFDTLEASRRARGPDVLGGHSLAMVCERELGIMLDKSAQTSEWSRRPLTAEQLAYAALDAEVLVALYDRFRDSAVDENSEVGTNSVGKRDG